MQFFYLTTAIVLSLGVSQFAGYERVMQQSDHEVRTEIEVTELHSEMFMRALRRESQLNPGSFPVPASQPAEIPSTIVERVNFGGFSLHGLVRYTIDNAGRIMAEIEDRTYDRTFIDEGLLSGTGKGGATASVPQLADAGTGVPATSALNSNYEQVRDRLFARANPAAEEGPDVAVGTTAVRQVLIGQLSPSDMERISTARRRIAAITDAPQASRLDPRMLH